MPSTNSFPSDSNKPQAHLSKRVLRIDRLMNRLVRLGGISVIITVLGIFLFILWQILPLFRSAQVSEVTAFQTDIQNSVLMGVDEWSELPFFLDKAGTFHFVDWKGERGTFEKVPDWSIPSPNFSAFAYAQKEQKVIFGTENGRFVLVEVGYKPSFAEDGKRSIEVELIPGKEFIALGAAGDPIKSIDFADYERRRLVAGIQGGIDGRGVYALSMTRKRSLLGAGKLKLDQRYDLSPLIEGVPEKVLVNSSADAVTILTTDGAIHYLVNRNGKFQLRQRFVPFASETDPRVASVDYLLGRVSLCLTHSSGKNVLYSLYRSPESGQREYGLTKQFPSLTGAADVFAMSQRNKAFLLASGKEVSLRFGTTAEIRWQKNVDYKPSLAAIGGKYDHVIIADELRRLHVYRLYDPHPEASLKSFFGKLWYEGQAEPEYTWQSSGATDDFEPKLSLIPLIFGSIKGTLFAMLFAVPIAILAAIYTAEFLNPAWRRIVKPTMEIMASLPSVVLGFLAALWLAPMIENKVPSLLLLLAAIILLAVFLPRLWMLLPVKMSRYLKPGYEFLLFFPLLMLVAWLAWKAGPILEQWVFVVQNPETGELLGDFRLWWQQQTGLGYEQRNSLVVGFMMGFAVIPIIFTIAEDSISQVPHSLASGSLALGASRWQTTVRVILPTAIAGIFSALMIGLGRAVGETMIVVMATGNTPIMDFNIFSGMRTLAANIAVELPEAPHHGTLYRTLFLGAMVLFLMTFLVNTLAEVLRYRLRKKYAVME